MNIDYPAGLRRASVRGSQRPVPLPAQPPVQTGFGR